MTTTLYGNTWVGDTAPTTPVWAGQQWVAPTSGTVYWRNSSNTAWVATEDINAQNSVQKSGDTMTGALTGVPNLAPVESPDFTGSAQLGGINLATQLMLAQLRQDLQSYITETVRAQFLAQTKLSGTAANVAFSSDVLMTTYSAISSGHSVSIPLPFFASDGVQASRTQILAYGWSLIVFSPGLDTNRMGLVEESPGSMTLIATGAWGYDTTVGIQYWAFAVR